MKINRSATFAYHWPVIAIINYSPKKVNIEIIYEPISP